MSLLGGEISSLFGEVFGSIYLDGTLTRMTRAEDPSSAGNIIETQSSQPCKVQRDDCSERQKLEQGYSARDVRLLVLAASISGTVKNGDRIELGDDTWTIGPTVARDPAGSYYECRGVPS